MEAMDKAHKPSGSEYYTPSSEPFRFCFQSLYSEVIEILYAGLNKLRNTNTNQFVNKNLSPGPIFFPYPKRI
jgi:hypothetical protein